MKFNHDFFGGFEMKEFFKSIKASLPAWIVSLISVIGLVIVLATGGSITEVVTLPNGAVMEYTIDTSGIIPLLEECKNLDEGTFCDVNLAIRAKMLKAAPKEETVVIEDEAVKEEVRAEEPAEEIIEEKEEEKVDNKERTE